MTEESLFAAALEAAPADRDAFLSRECPDPELRRQVERLLRLMAGAGQFLEGPATAAEPVAGALLETIPATTAEAAAGPIEPPTDVATGLVARPLTEGPGTRVGPYKLLQKIGEGGMGAVYMAEQERPVRRKVALKIIKPGMESDQVLARFEAERQALALMDHPNIARVLDAGVTETGRPYFVMELVKGIPVTEYCDQNRLTPRQRLDLFVPVCQAIQHAHQKGVIHRDVKPTNVLVTLYDGKPVPKVIDFGVAKAVEQRLTERTLFTQFGSVVGTFEYMSPEQAELSALDVDTRSDVYSLGVLLYELLTGTTPLERERVRQAAYGEILRRIKEEEPPRPSTRLSASGDRRASIAATRGTDPARLTRAVRGDLDWVVMKALEKDRTRRYESAGGFARDVERYLEGDPVEAGPPTAAYRLRKLARKHRTAIAIAGTFAMLLVAAAGVSTILAARATRAERLAIGRLAEVQEANAATRAALARSEESRRQADEVVEFLNQTFRSADPSRDGREIKVVELLDRASTRLETGFASDPKAQPLLLQALGSTYLGLGLYAKGADILARALAAWESAAGPENPDALFLRNSLACAYLSSGRIPEAIRMHEETLKSRRIRYGDDHADTLKSMHNLAASYNAAGRWPEAIRLGEEALLKHKVKLGTDHPDTLTLMGNLADAYLQDDRTDDAIRLITEVVTQQKATIGPDQPDTLTSMGILAAAYQRAGRLDDAIRLEAEILAKSTAKLGPDHPETLQRRGDLAAFYHDAGRRSEAMLLDEEVLAKQKAILGPDHPSTIVRLYNLARKYDDSGRVPESIALFEEALLGGRAKLGPDHPTTVQMMTGLGITYSERGDHARAEPLLREALTRQRAKLGPQHLSVATAAAQLGKALLRQGKSAEAERFFRECLTIRETAGPDEWTRYNAVSLLGAALAGQAKYDEAEPLLVQGFDGMKAREASMPGSSKVNLTEAGGRLIALYQAWGKSDQATAWKAKLGLADLPSDVFAPP